MPLYILRYKLDYIIKHKHNAHNITSVRVYIAYAF